MERRWVVTSCFASDQSLVLSGVSEGDRKVSVYFTQSTRQSAYILHVGEELVNYRVWFVVAYRLFFFRLSVTLSQSMLVQQKHLRGTAFLSDPILASLGYLSGLCSQSAARSPIHTKNTVAAARGRRARG